MGMGTKLLGISPSRYEFATSLACVSFCSAPHPQISRSVQPKNLLQIHYFKGLPVSVNLKLLKRSVQILAAQDCNASTVHLSVSESA
jgi:hypothetical protein